jgi:hypothetical protein
MARISKKEVMLPHPVENLQQTRNLIAVITTSLRQLLMIGWFRQTLL